MDGKELRSESVLTERSSDGGSKFTPSASTPPYDRTKPCQELGPNAFKVDGQGARPCAVIGPDRVAPPARDAFPKKAPVEPWLSPDSLYRRPPDYPHKMAEYQDPTRNISPRQTFQENMQRIIMPSGYNTVKVNEEAAYASKNNKLNMPMEAKYCDVPYNVNPMNSDQKNLRNTDHGVSNVNPMIVRSVPHGWPTGSVSVRPLRPYGAPEVYHYPEYANCTGPRPPLSRTHSSGHEEPPPLYSEPYYQEGNIRYKPYPNIKGRYPQPRYEYLGNYANPYHSPHPFPVHKYELPKTIPNHPYPGYPSAPLKYTDRAPEPIMDGYQRTFAQQGNYGVSIRNPVIHPPYRSVPGNSLHNKLHPYPTDGPNKPLVSNKQPYDPNNKMYVDYENSRPKNYPMSDNFYLSDMHRPYTKNPIILPNYPHANMHGVNPYLQMKNYEYARYKSLDPSIINNPLTKLPMQFSPTTLAISPADSNASNDTAQTHGTSQEDCGYVSQSSITSGRSIDNRLPMDLYGRHDYRFSPVARGSSLATPAPACTQMSKSKKDIRQFISSWNEGDEENLENNSKRDVIKNISTDTHTFAKQYEHSDSQEQLYVLGLVNVPSEELGKYEHIQKVSKLPENIKGYNSLELLNQFEEAIESSNINNINPPMQRELKTQTPLKTMTYKHDMIPRAVSPLDVEAKITQSVIHKDVACNFEIKPCSPKMLNVQVAAPVQTILNERVIEKVANPQSRKSPILLQHTNENMDSILNNKLMKCPLAGINSSCKMVNNQHLLDSTTVDHLKANYSLQELETNLGVCLASLPRLDNDIELNFPEVNQQFINANKTESVITKSFTNDLPALDIERTDISSLKNNSEAELDKHQAFSPKGKIDTDKECSRLSKYRKLKKNIKDDNDITQANVQATRVDSVIIKNPDNTRIFEDNSDAFRSGYTRKDSQEFAINLATQSKNSQAQSEFEEKLTKLNCHENTEKDSSTKFIIPAKTDNYSDNTDKGNEDLSTYRDVSNRYLERAVLDMPMNLSPQAKCYTHVDDEDFKNHKTSDETKRNTIVITKSNIICDVQNTNFEKGQEEPQNNEGGDVQINEPLVDSIRENLNSSPHSNVLEKSKADNDVPSLNSETEILAKVEHSTSNLHLDTQFLPAVEYETVSSLCSDTLSLSKTSKESSASITRKILSKLEEQAVSSLGSYTQPLSKAEEHTASSLNPETLDLSESGEKNSFDPDSLVQSKIGCTTSSLNLNTMALTKTENFAAYKLNSDGKCSNEENLNLCHAEKIETILSSTKNTIQSPDSNVHETETDKAMYQIYADTRNTISKLFDESNSRQDSLQHTPTDETTKHKSTRYNTKKSELSPQRNVIGAKYIKEVDKDHTVYLPKLERKTKKAYMTHGERNTECSSTTNVKSHSKKHKQKYKLTLHNKNKTLVGKSTDEPLITPDVNIDNISPSYEESNPSVITAQDINPTNASRSTEVSTTPEFLMQLSDGKQHISDVVKYDNPVLENTSTDTYLNVEKMAIDSTNVNFIIHTTPPSYKELECEISEGGSSTEKANQNEVSVDDYSQKIETHCVSNTTHLNNNYNDPSKETKYTPSKIKEKDTEIELLDFEDMSRNTSESCIVSDERKDNEKESNNADVIQPCIKKELFSSRFQNLLTYNEGASRFVNLNEPKTRPNFHKNNSLEAPQEAIPAVCVELHNDELCFDLKRIDNEHTETDKTKQCLLEEMDQQLSNTILPNSVKSFEGQCTDITHLSTNIVYRENENKLVGNDGKFVEDNSIKGIPLYEEQKSEDYEQSGNFIEESIHNGLLENCAKIFKNENISNEVSDAVTGIGKEIESEYFIDHLNDKGESIHLDDQNENILQKYENDDFISIKQDDIKEQNSYNLSNKPRRFLKRSLSDSALDMYDGDVDETSDNKCFLFPKKRKKCSNSNNLEESHLFNIIQNSRRNSISTLCNESNISFCILIDDNCILAEESYEQEDVNFGQTESSSVNNLQEDKSHEIPENLDIESTNEIECEGAKSWVENVGYEEIIETEDIAENIVIGEPTSPKDTDSSDYESDDGDMGILNSAAIDHTNKVKHIYGDNMCTNDAQLVDALYRTPQMDVNKKLMDKESQINEKTKYYDSDSLEMLLAEPIDNYKCSELPRACTSDYPTKDISCKKDLSFLETNCNVPGTENPECQENLTFSNINDITIKIPSQSCESSLDNVFSYERQQDGSYTSSSPEVSSTTSEENNCSLLLKISDYKGSKISEMNSLNSMHNRKENNCKFTEKEYLHPNYANHSQRPLITKAAQKYIPPLKETIPDLKVKLTLPQQSLLKLKEKASKEVLKHDPRSKSCKNNNIHLRKEIPKKVKPKFEDVLKNIDEVQFQKHKDRNKKCRKVIPKVVIKKTGNGSHYASTSAKTSFNPDLTGRKWQPWVFIEKNVFVDKMALRNKTKAVFSHRKKTFVLDEKFCKYKSISSAKFIITQPTLNELSTGNLKYTIKLKHSY